ncbi:hypothetical protein [Primorskyibacter sp. S187A]|uniref:hypothetical protein n=1 Tax=Primorskyibacter sp. S187A TaxID=3415130 RepID=UPI003C7AF7E4
MTRMLAVLLALGFVAGCDGSTGKDNPFEADPEAEAPDDTPTDPTDPADPALPVDPDAPTDAPTVPEDLFINTTNVTIAPDGNTISVTTKGIDGTPESVTYARNNTLKISTTADGDGIDYVAYTKQEDALDRLFIAIGGDSADGSVTAFTVGGGPQFNEVQQGGFYRQNGTFTRPAVGDGPGAGQVSYAGDYAAVTNIGQFGGPALLPIPPGTDEDIQPLEAARIVGSILLNANFVDNQVNGSVYARTLLLPDGTEEDLNSLALLITDINDEGAFLGEVEITNEVGQTIGNYGGTFGGTNASAVGGLVSIDRYDETREGELENGVFVLTQCGQPDDAPICDAVAP